MSDREPLSPHGRASLPRHQFQNGQVIDGVRAHLRDTHNISRESPLSILPPASNTPAGAILLAFSPDGKQLTSASWDRIVRLWDTATGDRLQLEDDRATAVVFSPDGKQLALDYLWPYFSFGLA